MDGGAGLRGRVYDKTKLTRCYAPKGVPKTTIKNIGGMRGFTEGHGL